MRRREFLLIAGCIFASTVWAQPGAHLGPIAGRPKIEIRGRIEKVQAGHGQGMPYLEVKTQDGTAKVYLGSVRYLMEQDFNPKSGEEVVVKGYKMDDSIVAITVELPASGKLIKLRDSDGRPVWMRGRYGGPMKKSK